MCALCEQLQDFGLAWVAHTLSQTTINGMLKWLKRRTGVDSHGIRDERGGAATSRFGFDPMHKLASDNAVRLLSSKPVLTQPPLTHLAPMATSRHFIKATREVNITFITVITIV